jgi:hypothetical protein
LRQRNRSRQSGRPATDDNHIVYDRRITHIGTIDVPGGIFKPVAAAMFSPKWATKRRNRGCTNRGDS